MPFVKHDVPVSAKTPQRDLGAELKNLQSADLDARWNAARALGGCAEAVPALAAALAVEPNSQVREAIATGRNCPRKLVIASGVPLLEQIAPLLGNVNTPEDLAAAHQQLATGSHI